MFFAPQGPLARAPRRAPWRPRTAAASVALRYIKRGRRGRRREKGPRGRRREEVPPGCALREEAPQPRQRTEGRQKNQRPRAPREARGIYPPPRCRGCSLLGMRSTSVYGLVHKIVGMGILLSSHVRERYARKVLEPHARHFRELLFEPGVLNLIGPSELAHDKLAVHAHFYVRRAQFRSKKLLRFFESADERLVLCEIVRGLSDVFAHFRELLVCLILNNDAYACGSGIPSRPSVGVDDYFHACSINHSGKLPSAYKSHPN